MNLSDALKVGAVKTNLTGREKYSVIAELVNLADQSNLLTDREDFLAAINAREQQQSTGLESGVAIPHSLAKSVKQVFACLGISRSGVPFQSMDGKPAQFIFLIGAPPGMNTQYLSILSKVARIFTKADVRARVLDAASPEEVIEIIQKEEENISGTFTI